MQRTWKWRTVADPGGATPSPKLMTFHHDQEQGPVLSSGVTTDPADPAMRGARGPVGAQNCGVSYLVFSLKI